MRILNMLASATAIAASVSASALAIEVKPPQRFATLPTAEWVAIPFRLMGEYFSRRCLIMKCSPRQLHARSVPPPRCVHVSGLARLQSALALMSSLSIAVVGSHSSVAPISIRVQRGGWRIIRPGRAIGRLQIVGKFLSPSKSFLLSPPSMLPQHGSAKQMFGAK
jgi:hypothetical protein